MLKKALLVLAMISLSSGNFCMASNRCFTSFCRPTVTYRKTSVRTPDTNQSVVVNVGQQQNNVTGKQGWMQTLVDLMAKRAEVNDMINAYGRAGYNVTQVNQNQYNVAPRQQQQYYQPARPAGNTVVGYQKSTLYSNTNLATDLFGLANTVARSAQQMQSDGTALNDGLLGLADNLQNGSLEIARINAQTVGNIALTEKVAQAIAGAIANNKPQEVLQTETYQQGFEPSPVPPPVDGSGDIGEGDAQRQAATANLQLLAQAQRILNDRCVQCHQEKKMAFPLQVAQLSDNQWNILVDRITTNDPDKRMPKGQQPLSVQEQRLLIYAAGPGG